MDKTIIVMVCICLVFTYSIFFAIALADESENKLLAILSILVCNFALLCLCFIFYTVKEDFIISVILTVWLALFMNILVIEINKLKQLS